MLLFLFGDTLENEGIVTLVLIRTSPGVRDENFGHPTT